MQPSKKENFRNGWWNQMFAFVYCKVASEFFTIAKTNKYIESTSLEASVPKKTVFFLKLSKIK